MADQDDRRRRLAAIMSADVAGYSRLMQDDEDATVTTLDDYRSVFRERIAAHDGRVVDTAGDSVLAVFETATGAVRVADEIQQELAKRNETLPDERRMHFRIGVNLGEVIEKVDGTIYGDGVNIAARLENLAEPGGICVSESAHMQVEGKLEAVFESIGEHAVKNIAKPIQAYRLVAHGVAPRLGSRRYPAWAAAAALVFVIAGVAVWQTTQPPPASPPKTTTQSKDPVLALPTGPRIAVLAFDNLSSDPDQDYFADGLAEEIIAALTQFTNLNVVARNSSFAYRGTATDMRTIGKELDAQFVVEGSMRRAGDTIRVTAQLIEVATNTHVWAETYERTLTTENVFAIQDEITSQLVAKIADDHGVISRLNLQTAARKPPEDLSSYECVLRSYEWDRLFGAGGEALPLYLAARECVERVVARDPTYAEAWTRLSILATYEHTYKLAPRPEPLQRALRAAKKAVELDPASASARSALAYTYYHLHKIDDFLREANVALSLNPNDQTVLGELGNYIAYTGQWEKGVNLVKKAIALGKSYPTWIHMAFAKNHFRKGEYEAALTEFQNVKWEDYWMGQLEFAYTYGALERRDEADAAVAKLRELYPGFDIETSIEVYRAWNFSDGYIDRMVAALRWAGLPEAPPEPTRPVIAVLPFTNMSGDPEQEYFADGITEDIITRLAQYPDLLVLGRNTTFQFKGQALDVKDIAAKLGADYVVEGSVRRSGDTVRVTAQLLGAADGAHVWAETFDRTLDAENLFAIQDEITEAVATRIGDPHGAISVAELKGLSRQAPARLSSYECVLRYYEHERVLTANSHKVARDCLEQVVEAEPEYGLAASALGAVYHQEFTMGLNPTPETSLARALEMSEKGLRLDPSNGLTHVHLAILLLITGDPERAAREAEEAVRLSPNNAEVLGAAALVQVNTGGYDRTKALMDKLMVVNPNYPPWMNWSIAKYHLVRHEYLDAITWFERTGMDWWYWTQAYLAATHCARGDIERGQQALAAALEANPDLAEIYWPETHMWFKGDGVYPLMDIVGAGLEACGWDVPPDPQQEG